MINEQEEIYERIRTVFMEKIPFNKVLGLVVEALEPERAVLKLAMRDELVGNWMRGVLHGGVISSTLDVAGGLVAFLGLLEKNKEDPLEQKLSRFSKLGTIDLRIDYLRPGQGEYFLATSYVLRTGNKVAVTRMELHNEKEELIAVGTAAYTVS